MAYGMLLDAAREMIGAALKDIQYDAQCVVEPARPGFGDASCNVAFLLARVTGERPADLAGRIAGRCVPGGIIQKVEAHPTGYLNVWADWNALGGLVIRACTKEGYGGGFGDKVSVVEHTSVNPNKALHIGHVRNVVVGDSVSRILRKAGDQVTVLNYVDDSGLQVANVVLGFMQLGYEREPPPDKKFDAYCGDVVYVEVSGRAKEDKALNEKIGSILADIEKGGTESARVAAEVTRRVLADQLETCWRLGASYDMLNYESQILRSGLWSDVFGMLKKMGIARLETDGKNAGCWIIQDKVIVRSNGTATYMAKDIPYAAWKLGLVNDPFAYGEYCTQPDGTTLRESVLGGGPDGRRDVADRVITVIDSRQAGLQKTVSSIMKQLGGGSYIHLGYEAVTLSADTAKMLGVRTDGDSQMSGRRGIYVGADAMYELLQTRAAGETVKRNPDMPAGEVDSISGAVAVGAMRYEMIRQDLGRAITFDMERSTRLDGDTGPYLQYAAVRAGNILRKHAAASGGEAEGGELPSSASLQRHLADESLWQLVLKMSMSRWAAARAAGSGEPAQLARNAFQAAQAFSNFYHHTHILNEGDPERKAVLLAIVRLAHRELADQMSVMGMPVPTRM